MEQEKKELISTLLSLKAGLSLLHSEVDKITTAEKEYNFAHEVQIDAEKFLKRSEDNLEQLKKKAAEQSYEFNEFNDKQNKKKKEGKRAIAFAIVAFIVGIVVLVADFPGFGSAFSGFFFFAGLGMLFYGYQIAYPSRFKIPVAPPSDAIRGLEEYGAAYKEDIFLHKKDVAEKTAKCNAAKAVYEKTYDEVYPCAKIIFDTLYDTFDDTLRMEQWQYLDLIIYYLYCDLADTKKEALLLVEKERQKRDIVDAIMSASAEICNTIRTEAALIRLDMGMHFNKLSAQISDCHKRMMSEIGTVNHNLAENASRLSKINDAQNLQNELLGKMEVNSKSLADSASYIARKAR